MGTNGFSWAGKQRVNKDEPVRPQIYNTRKKGTKENGQRGEEKDDMRGNDEMLKQEDEEEEEGNVPRRLRDPRKPSQAEVDEHNIKHYPFREWCRHCMDGKDKITSTGGTLRRRRRSSKGYQESILTTGSWGRKISRHRRIPSC